MRGYDHGKQAGTVSVANHHVAPGKKFWEWSAGPRGALWDHILTEQDGPELELMTGAYSDNQPDYSWLQPFESKTVRLYWFPIRELGGLKYANIEGALNFELGPDGSATDRGQHRRGAQRCDPLAEVRRDDALLGDAGHQPGAAVFGESAGAGRHESRGDWVDADGP